MNPLPKLTITACVLAAFGCDTPWQAPSKERLDAEHRKFLERRDQTSQWFNGTLEAVNEKLGTGLVSGRRSMTAIPGMRLVVHDGKQAKAVVQILETAESRSIGIVLARMAGARAIRPGDTVDYTKR